MWTDVCYNFTTHVLIFVCVSHTVLKIPVQTIKIFHGYIPVSIPGVNSFGILSYYWTNQCPQQVELQNHPPYTETVGFTFFMSLSRAPDTTFVVPSNPAHYLAQNKKLCSHRLPIFGSSFILKIISIIVAHSNKNPWSSLVLWLCHHNTRA